MKIFKHRLGLSRRKLAPSISVERDVTHPIMTLKPTLEPLKGFKNISRLLSLAYFFLCTRFDSQKAHQPTCIGGSHRGLSNSNGSHLLQPHIFKFKFKTQKAHQPTCVGDPHRGPSSSNGSHPLQLHILKFKFKRSRLHGKIEPINHNLSNALS